ncbi:ABC transporter substrate-binding protein [Cellulomonas wangsupingiae]|uniref:ABC transporter substrate-binding protein n=1 Tax=Cellulomonas wangsupingiae TaxID=2968085 RepID=A0ABY5K6X3_9CELL|nr:ABC transporter substrate-binding protein [Cellulomonas wangsupingiae]MCC2334430.1 ABC transporter substrate-binding protein [Cellulomonas wangsupingiae]UUI66095.1 ABC transporter substrate-binding protein [Cellulomonas wangsupingiae]
MRGRRRRGGGVVAVAAAAALAVTTTACTATPPDPARAGTVVVSSDLPFASLNGATAAGRAPGSVLVRGLVQSGFTTLADDGTVDGDASFGTVEKVADAPLTVRYTIAPTATWSDGVPVTPADLLLEWAARSGQLDEVVPELDADGEPVGDLGDVVAFGATSAALARASAVPVVDGATVTVVYDSPVADWHVALDVNLPAHVVGRLALDPQAPSFPATTPTPSQGTTPTPSGGATTAATTSADATAAPSPDATAGEPDAAAAARWADAVVTAVQQQDRASLVPVSRVWRSAGRAGDVAADPTLTTTTGPYVLARVDGDGVEAVRNDAYTGDRPAAFDRVRVRTDLDPLAQVEALADDELDVAAPVSTPDVLTAATELEGVTVSTGGDAVLQVVLQEAGGGLFDPAAHASAPDPAAAAAELRTAFLASVRRDEAVRHAVGMLWAEAEVSDVVAAQVGPQAPAVEDPTAADPPDGPGDDGPLTVRVLTNLGDPVRAAVVGGLVDAGAAAGFTVVPVEVDDPARALRAAPQDWDAALVPVAQEDLPVAGLAARWRTGGATNVTGHTDPALDAVLDALVAQPDPQAAAQGVTQAAEALVTWGAVLPVARTPVLTVSAARDAEDDDGLPVVGDVPVLTPSAADLTWWWGWTRR